MAPHSSTLAWKIPWMEEPGRLQSMGSLESDTTERLHFHFSLSCIGEGNGNPLQCSCLENPRDGGAWWAAIYGVAQSRTQLNRLSSSSSQSIVTSASALVLPMNIQSWFPLGLTGWSPCCPRDSQESSPVPQFEGIDSLMLSLLYGSAHTLVHDYWKNHSFHYTDLCWQSDVSAF